MPGFFMDKIFIGKINVVGRNDQSLTTLNEGLG